MEKKTIFLELPAEMIDRIDKQNTLGDRSMFISNLLQKQLKQDVSTMDVSTELTTRMDAATKPQEAPGEIGLVDSNGVSLGRFDINTIEGFENLAQKISELTEDPIVRVRARWWW